MTYFTDFHKKLMSATVDCRPDMHEPDEQEVSAIVRGDHLDNAMGNDPEDNCGELTIGITRDGQVVEWFNLATLIALARAADPAKLDKPQPRYRVWNIVNFPNSPKYHYVYSPEHGAQVIDKLANEQLKDDTIESNAFGLETNESGEWEEWYSEDGLEINEAFDDA